MRVYFVVVAYGRTVATSKCLCGNLFAGLACKELSNDLCTVFVHFVDTRAAVNLGDLALLVVVLDNRHGGFLVNAFGGDKPPGEHAVGGESLTESFLDAFFVVIFSATGLASLQKPLQHDFLGRGIE